MASSHNMNFTFPAADHFVPLTAVSILPYVFVLLQGTSCFFLLILVLRFLVFLSFVISPCDLQPPKTTAVYYLPKAWSSYWMPSALKKLD